MLRGGRSRLEGNLFPIQVLHLSVFFKIFLIEHQHRANNGRIILKANLRDKVGDDIEKTMGVNNGKGACRRRGVGNFFVGPFGKVLHHVSQKLKLVNEVRELGGMNLSKLRFEEG